MEQGENGIVEPSSQLQLPHELSELLPFASLREEPFLSEENLPLLQDRVVVFEASDIDDSVEKRDSKVVEKTASSEDGSAKGRWWSVEEEER